MSIIIIIIIIIIVVVVVNLLSGKIKFTSTQETVKLFEICTILVFCPAQNGSFLPMCRDYLLVPSSRVFLDCLAVEDGADRLSRSDGNKLTFYAA